MREIWTKEAAEFHGEFVNFRRSGPTRSRPEAAPPILEAARASHLACRRLLRRWFRAGANAEAICRACELRTRASEPAKSASLSCRLRRKGRARPSTTSPTPGSPTRAILRLPSDRPRRGPPAPWTRRQKLISELDLPGSPRAPAEARGARAPHGGPVGSTFSCSPVVHVSTPLVLLGDRRQAKRHSAGGLRRVRNITETRACRWSSTATTKSGRGWPG